MIQNDETLTRLLDALSTLRVPATGTEYDLHALIAASLERGGFVVSHEEKLGPRCRIDFLVGDIGIEVKRGKIARRPLLAQCTRYLSSDRLRALIVVGEKAFHLPETLCGKPLIAFGVNRLWGVALP